MIASSLAKAQVKRELVCTLPIAAMKAATAVDAMNAVAAPPDPVAWYHISYIGTLQNASDGAWSWTCQSLPCLADDCCLNVLDAIQHRYGEEESGNKANYKTCTDCARHCPCWLKAILC